MATRQDDTIIGTPAMVEAAVAQALGLIRQGKWPAPYEGDDQLDHDDDVLAPARPMPLKAAE